MYGYTALQHTTLMCVVHSAHHTDLLGPSTSMSWDCIPIHIPVLSSYALLPETQYCIECGESSAYSNHDVLIWYPAQEVRSGKTLWIHTLGLSPESVVLGRYRLVLLAE